MNGGPWQTAPGTASWSRSLTLSPCVDTIEARSRDRAGNYSITNLVEVTYNAPNTAPGAPLNVSPAPGAANVALSPVLEASLFSDPDCSGDTHLASQWQVLIGSSGSTIVWDSGTNAVEKTRIVLAAGKLNYAASYRWRVRYQDNRGAWSSYSPEPTFITLPPSLVIRTQGTA